MPDRNANTGALVEFTPEPAADASSTGALVEWVPEPAANNSSAATLIEWVPALGANSAAVALLVEWIPPPEIERGLQGEHSRAMFDIQGSFTRGRRKLEPTE